MVSLDPVINWVEKWYNHLPRFLDVWFASAIGAVLKYKKLKQRVSILFCWVQSYEDAQLLTQASNSFYNDHTIVSIHLNMINFGNNFPLFLWWIVGGVTWPLHPRWTMRFIIILLRFSIHQPFVSSGASRCSGGWSASDGGTLSSRRQYFVPRPLTSSRAGGVRWSIFFLRTRTPHRVLDPFLSSSRVWPSLTSGWLCSMDWEV